MNITTTPIPGLLILEPAVFHDERGYFYESFNARRFNEALSEHGQAAVEFVQDNQSASHAGVLRGLHYQLPPFAQGKLVRVTRGAVWDVAVDVRKSSATCGQWFGLELSADNKKQFWIPAGFAHGFVALEDGTEFLYKTTAFYDKNSERAIVWNDRRLGIAWPSVPEYRVNAKDQQAPGFDCADLFA